MAEPVLRPLTFEEFASLNSQGRYELVDGRLEELVATRPFHGLTFARVTGVLESYVAAREEGGYLGAEVDIPTLPYHGRRPDLVYYAPEDAARIDLDADRMLGVPTLAIEIVSPDDEDRDTVVKREEYARVGILHYWILDPGRGTVLTLSLRGGEYEVVAEFGGEDVLTSELFPGLRVPLSRLFRRGG